MDIRQLMRLTRYDLTDTYYVTPDTSANSIIFKFKMNSKKLVHIEILLRDPEDFGRSNGFSSCVIAE